MVQQLPVSSGGKYAYLWGTSDQGAAGRGLHYADDGDSCVAGLNSSQHVVPQHAFHSTAPANKSDTFFDRVASLLATPSISNPSVGCKEKHHLPVRRRRRRRQAGAGRAAPLPGACGTFALSTLLKSYPTWQRLAPVPQLATPKGAGPCRTCRTCWAHRRKGTQDIAAGGLESLSLAARNGCLWCSDQVAGTECVGLVAAPTSPACSGRHSSTRMHPARVCVSSRRR